MQMLYNYFSNFTIFSCFLLAIVSPVWSLTQKPPTILIVTLLRNKAHILPYFLTFLHLQDYDKQRISLSFVSDHNQDESILILETWLEHTKESYHSVHLTIDRKNNQYDDETGPGHWSEKRLFNVINARERELIRAKELWADYMFSLDADVLLVDPNTLSYLISQNYPIIAPMLRANGLYSNFWAGMSENYYYLRTDDYQPILKGEKKGCFAVPMVHSAVLVNLNVLESDKLTYNKTNLANYEGPVDDIITFALSANLSDLPLHVCNEKSFGFIMVPIEVTDSLEQDYDQLTNVLLEILVELPSPPVANYLERFVRHPLKDRLGLDAIYIINLERRPERRIRMESCMNHLGLEVIFTSAVDGRNLDEKTIKQLGIQFLPEYSDPYHKRPMTRGEIGCFLSHYNIWKEVVEKKFSRIMILEDDVRFEPFFKQKVFNLLQELQTIQLSWDLIYLGRKRLEENETWVEGSKSLVHVAYSYWTLGYLLSFEGAEKLLAPDPLKSLLPVDEYLPILFDRHPESKWKEYFPVRDLRAFGVAPYLLYPTHYTGEKGYISDTEDSSTISSFNLKKEEL